MPANRERLQERIVVREGAVHDIHEHGGSGRIEAAPLLVALQRGVGARIEPDRARFRHHIYKGADILETKIEALTGQRVDPVGGVTQQGTAVGDQLCRQLEMQWIGEVRTIEGHRPGKI